MQCRELTFRRTACSALAKTSVTAAETLDLALYRLSLDQALDIILCFITYKSASSRPHKEHNCTRASWLMNLASREWRWQPHWSEQGRVNSPYQSKGMTEWPQPNTLAMEKPSPLLATVFSLAGPQKKFVLTHRPPVFTNSCWASYFQKLTGLPA